MPVGFFLSAQSRDVEPPGDGSSTTFWCRGWWRHGSKGTEYGASYDLVADVVIAAVVRSDSSSTLSVM